jgi:hypothetical protein
MTKSKQLAFSDPDLKTLKTLYSKYGADLITAELTRIMNGPPVREAGAPATIHPMSYVAVYLDIQQRKVVKDGGKDRRRPLSVSEACDELSAIFSTFTADVRYASKSLQAMYRKGRKLLEDDPGIQAAFLTLGRSSDGHQITIPFISTEITSDGSLRGPVIDRLARGGRD